MRDTAAGLAAWHGPFDYAGLPVRFCPGGDGRVERGQSASVDTRTGLIWHDYCAMRHIAITAASAAPLSLSRRS